MGAGPEKLFAAGAQRLLTHLGHEVIVRRIEDRGIPEHEVGATFELNRRLASTVSAAIRDGAFPLILAGNCNSCLGTLSGVGDSSIGILWFDAHGDFNTPDTSSSGFFDGMCLNAAVGGCWRAASRSIPGFAVVNPERVALLGVRDLDQAERELLDGSDVGVVEYREVRELGISGAVIPALDTVSGRTRDVYVHVDLDVLSGDRFTVNEFSGPGGLSLEQLLEVLGLIGVRFNVLAAAATAYDPGCDQQSAVCEAALQVIGRLAAIGGNGERVTESG
jgi:arginase